MDLCWAWGAEPREPRGQTGPAPFLGGMRGRNAEKWSNVALNNKGNQPVIVESGHGVDYGQPRTGIDTFELTWMLLHPPEKACVTTWGPGGADKTCE